MSAAKNDVLEPPVQQMLERGSKTLKGVLARAGASGMSPLQTTTNEVGFLIAAAKLAIEEVGASVGVEETSLNEARLRGLKRMVELRKAAEPVLETGEVCALLGVSRETVRKKVDRKRLLALPKGGDRVFPAFQFRDGDVLPGIQEVLLALDTDSPFVELSFLLSKSEDLGGRSPCELLQAGHVEPVLVEARGLLKHGA